MAVVVGAVFFFRDGRNEPAGSNDSTGFIVSNNAIYVADQLPGRSVSIAVMQLEKPGFVVILKDNAGTPGKILGVSGALPTWETKNIGPIGLSRITKDGEVLYAMLYLDDGDDVFDSAKDKPALDSLGDEPVLMIFSVSTNASEVGAVNP